jgi:magnesium-transporting ATPase (P-type)
VRAAVREKGCGSTRHMALVKGSPEVISTLLTTKPEGYDLVHTHTHTHEHTHTHTHTHLHTHTHTHTIYIYVI